MCAIDRSRLRTSRWSIRFARVFVKNVRPLYSDVPEERLQSFVLKPGVAVEFEVQEVYLQTPGPGAGTRLVPPAEAK